MVLDKLDMIQWLQTQDKELLLSLFDQAYAIKRKAVGPKVYLRGLIEVSNICQKNCYYCGIRSGNQALDRYVLSDEEVLLAAEKAYQRGYGSIVLQAGEQQSDFFTSRVDNLIKKIRIKTSKDLGITLSLGEQSYQTYKRWFDAGAHRYLLRIETSNEKLYSDLHPQDHDFSKRKNCLRYLKEVGYQVGTGVIIGIPGQTETDLINDLFYYQEADIDMIGMGPYIPHRQAPLAHQTGLSGFGRNFDLTLKMIALTRIMLEDVNIAATTALQALHPQGREWGIRVGANVVMPNITPLAYRGQYQLYENKPHLDDEEDLNQSALAQGIQSLGEMFGYREWGDAPHFYKRLASKR